MGVDLSPHMLAQARRKYGLRQPKLGNDEGFAALLCQSIEEPLPADTCPDASFDAVVCAGVLEFVRRPAALFGTCRAKLREGGVLALGVPLRDEERGDAVGRGLGVRTYARDGVVRVAGAAGFELAREEPIHGYTCDNDDGESVTVRYAALWFRAVAVAVAVADDADAVTPDAGADAQEGKQTSR